MEPGEIHRLEMEALEDEIRKDILSFIGFELRKLEDIGENAGLSDEELQEHISKLEKGLLVEIDGEFCKLSPRCIAYLGDCSGYEWVR